MMNQGNSSSQVTFSDANASKTVAAFLKQVKGQQDPKEITRLQQQPQNQTKGSEQNLQPSHRSHLTMSKDNPQGHVISAAVLPTCIRNVSPVRTEPGHFVATKNSSLSLDRSPSLVTAQMGRKVMAESTANITQPNLLRSALQGNMPDPMGILNSKTDRGMLTVVATTAGSLYKFNPLKRSTPAIISSSSTSSNSISTSHHLNHTFKKILTSIGGTSDYLGQDDHVDSKSSTIENILASTDGTIQTINVSHIPKSMSDGSIIGSLSGSVSSHQTTAARSSSAMEIAEQIRIEASGSAQVRSGVHQQLKSQMQSSRSIDAQLAPHLTPVTCSKEQSLIQRTPSKEIEHKMLDTKTLLASKLAPFAKLTASSMDSQFGQQQQITEEPSVLMPSLSLKLSVPSSLTPSFSTPSTSSIYVIAKKSSQNVIPAKPPIEPPMQQQQQQNLKNNQQMKDENLMGVKESHLEPGMSNGHSWLHPWQQARSDSQSTVLNISELYSEEDKQQKLERFIQQSNMNNSLIEMTVQTDGRTESHGKHLYSHHSKQKGSTKPPLISSFQNLMEDINQDFSCESNVIRTGKAGHSSQGTNSASLTHTSQTVSKSKSGESHHTAADEPLGLGQLASVKSPIRNTDMAGKGSRLHSVVDNQFCTSISSISGCRTEQTSTISRDSQSFVPVHTSTAFTVHSVQEASSLSQIPTCTVPASSSLPFSFATSANLPLTLDYTQPSPYHDRQNQQSQYQQILTIKTYQADKHSVENPFTFPTTGVKLPTDPHFSDPISFASTSPYNSIYSNSDDIRQQELHSTFSQPKEVSVLPSKYQTGKYQSNFSAASNRHGKNTCQIFYNDMPGVLPEACPMQEISKVHDNHLGEVNEITRAVEQPFNQRISNLSCFPVMNSTYRAAYRSHVTAVQRAKSGVITDISKTLDVLRQNLQHCINKEITDTVKRYINKYFQPALKNIKQNGTEGFIEEEYINHVCRQILEEAKAEFMSNTDRRSDTPDNSSESGSLTSRRMGLKRSRISDSDSEKGSESGYKKKAAKNKGRPAFQSTGRIAPFKSFKSGEVKREGTKWDPERLKSDTLFVMGARANKALGLGNTRGRLYIRHPDVFKYIGDQADKQWLCDHSLMPPTGGKAYMLVLEDIEDLSRSDEYKDSPGLMMHECVGFTVPDWMLVKIKGQMNALALDSNKRSLSLSPAHDVGEQSDSKILPFSSFAETTIKEEITVPPADTEEMVFLSAADNDDIQHSSAISPFTLTGGFEDMVSPSTSDLDPTEDTQPIPSFFPSHDLMQHTST